MEQVLHASARTTPAIRRALQTSSESTAHLARHYGLNEKTVAKWRGRTSTQDAPMGPKDPHSTVLSAAEEAAAVLFRQQTCLPLDDCLYALQETIPHLSRSALHRLFQRQGISQLPVEAPPNQAEKKKFKDYPIGYFHLDFAEVRTAQGKHYVFVAVDRTSKLAFAELASEATVATALAFWQRVVAAVPYRIHKVLTDNGVQFASLPHRPTPLGHLFDQYCGEQSIEHRRTKVAHPWTNGQVERLNRTVKEATVQRYFYQTQQELNDHLQTFLAAYNGAKRLKKLRGQTPYEFVCAEYTKNPTIFTRDPTHDFVGLY
ncbi:IS481 family transposase, partial [Hymenobacter sp. H14-R3]|uniref:IS481 family transposase n=1 Tax=Hymenobacter sp. H14-R3 TaxID=3046308 RepID=UPI0024BAC6D4